MSQAKDQTITITITDDQVNQAKKEIREWFPGTHNKDL